jgi:hypothetical protein
MRAVLALGSLKEEEYMRLIKGALEPKDRLVPPGKLLTSLALFRQASGRLS